jgi:hypothetical protein
LSRGLNLVVGADRKDDERFSEHRVHYAAAPALANTSKGCTRASRSNSQQHDRFVHFNLF